MNISREQAACMFYGEEFNEINKSVLVKRIDDIKDVDICYIDDQTDPVLVSQRKMNINPFRYHKYLSIPETKPINEMPRAQLTSDTMIITFLNEAFLACSPHNDEVYSLECMTTNEILAVVSRYTSLFDDKSSNSFLQWCLRRKIKFTKATVSRKRAKGQKEKIGFRNVYAMKRELIDNVAESIATYLPRYQEYIGNLHKEGFQVIGYARKSIGKEDEDTRIRLLQNMVERLAKRSLVKKVFVSPSSSASEKISARDTNEVGIARRLKNVDGNTQDLISFIAATENVCLVVLDFAGITTDAEDLRSFVQDNSNLKMIVIDQLPFQHEVKLFQRNQLLNDPQALENFICRKSCVQRSK
ncbi:hypothetical protein DM01DRAFT_1323617 [Hesseltinella vesiculosa]|uniref:Uncharacterized protein n=1 Tax=Hesseltinella vesiculosa TaxID=101127 RepID=A0A1X2GFC3_9FUNG|nr:hypothetical protein DM01DRAFT_1323617 [Hesseltinella vesiculosa]